MFITTGEKALGQVHLQAFGEHYWLLEESASKHLKGECLECLQAQALKCLPYNAGQVFDTLMDYPR